MLEYGIIPNNRINGAFSFQYPYCSFQRGEQIYIAEPYKNRIAIIDEKTLEMNTVGTVKSYAQISLQAPAE